MKKITLVTFMLFLSSPCFGDEVRSHIDAKGNITYTNSGPTIQEQQQRDQEREKKEQEIETKKSHTIASAIALRHKELISDPNLSEALFNTGKKYIMQGNSHSNSLLLAEKEMISLGYLRDEDAIRAERERIAEIERRKIAEEEDDAKRRAKRRVRNKIAEEEDDAKRRVRNQQEVSNASAHGNIINQPAGGMKMDTNGTFYMDAGGGNMTSTKDGTFMQKAAGGYIDTKTGQFVPSI